MFKKKKIMLEKLQYFTYYGKLKLQDKLYDTIVRKVFDESKLGLSEIHIDRDSSAILEESHYDEIITFLKKKILLLLKVVIH